MNTARLSFDLEMIAAARHEPAERSRRRWRLVFRRLTRPTKRESAARLSAWRLTTAREAEVESVQRRDAQFANGGKLYIHRSMRLAVESIDQNDLAMARRHVELGIERWEAEGLPLYGQQQPENQV